MLLAVSDGQFADFASRDFALEPAVGRSQSRGVPAQHFVALMQMRNGLPRGALGRLQRNQCMREKSSSPFHRAIAPIIEIVRCRQGDHGLFVHDGRVQRDESAGQNGPAQFLGPVNITRALLAKVRAERR